MLPQSYILSTAARDSWSHSRRDHRWWLSGCTSNRKPRETSNNDSVLALKPSWSGTLAGSCLALMFLHLLQESLLCRQCCASSCCKQHFIVALLDPAPCYGQLIDSTSVEKVYATIIIVRKATNKISQQLQGWMASQTGNVCWNVKATQAYQLVRCEPAKWDGFPRDQLKISGIPCIDTSSNFICTYEIHKSM